MEVCALYICCVICFAKCRHPSRDADAPLLAEVNDNYPGLWWQTKSWGSHFHNPSCHRRLAEWYFMTGWWEKYTNSYAGVANQFCSKVEITLVPISSEAYEKISVFWIFNLQIAGEAINHVRELLFQRCCSKRHTRWSQTRPEYAKPPAPFFLTSFLSRWLGMRKDLFSFSTCFKANLQHGESVYIGEVYCQCD